MEKNLNIKILKKKKIEFIKRYHSTNLDSKFCAKFIQIIYICFFTLKEDSGQI